MGIWFMMLGFNLLIPAIMLGAGKLFTKNTPKDINWIIGYRTTMSMKNEDTWAFAHKVAGAFWWKWGWVALVITVVGMLLLLGRSVELVSTAGCVLLFLQLVPVIAVIPHTEKALHNIFDKDGKRKADESCGM